MTDLLHSPLMQNTYYLVGVLLWLSARGALADSVDDLVRDYMAKRPLRSVQSGLTLAEAKVHQAQFVQALSRHLGLPIGYKVGLVTPVTQERYGLKSPVRGVLLREMVKTDQEVPASFGARPLFEADLIVVVKNDGINEAKTLIEAARNLSEVVAFIELPDALVPVNVNVDGPMLVANNVGARLGVLGTRAPIEATPEFVRALSEMSIVMTDESGAELARAQASVILGHPLNAVLWLTKDLAAEGKRLKPGDLISLGSIAPPQTPRAGQRVDVRYVGLPSGELKATVRFNP